MSERIDYNEVAPRGMKALAGVHVYASQSGLAPELLTAVYLRVSLINGCAYCIDMHSRELRELGVSTRRSPWCRSGTRPASCSTPARRRRLAWAETVTRVSTTGVPDSAYEAASAHFDEKELVDLTIAIGMMNAYNRMAISFRSVPAAAV